MFQMDEYLWRCFLEYQDPGEIQSSDDAAEKECDKQEMKTDTPNDETFVCGTAKEYEE